MMAQWQHGFYKQSLENRQALIADRFQLTAAQRQLLVQNTSAHGDQMIENYVGEFTIPEGLVLNLVVNQHAYCVPLVTEEPSVVAAANNGAKIVAQSGGFTAPSSARQMIGQVVLSQITELAPVTTWLKAHTAELLTIANQAHPSMKARGAGAQQLKLRPLPDGYLSVDLLIDVSEAMGANVVNTMCEAVAHHLRTVGYHVVTAILSNLATASTQTVNCQIELAQLATGEWSGEQVAAQIAELSHLAQIDPYRAATHNKGIMNGIDAAVIASGNDWRAVESGAHAAAVRDGQYRGLSEWQVVDDQLCGKLVVPLPLGTVGGSIGIVPMVQLNRRLTQFKSVHELAAVIASVGLAQNLAALKALATTGIQAGHMKLQYRSLALAVGAQPTEVESLATRLGNLSQVDRQVAVDQLMQLRKEQTNGRS
jgi:hydroxymethylglutaryl-CoA reductase